MNLAVHDTVTNIVLHLVALENTLINVNKIADWKTDEIPFSTMFLTAFIETTFEKYSQEDGFSVVFRANGNFLEGLVTM